MGFACIEMLGKGRGKGDAAGKGRGKGASMGKRGGRGSNRDHKDLENVTPSLRISSSQHLDDSGSLLPPLPTESPSIHQHTPGAASNDAPGSSSHAERNISSSRQQDESGPNIQTWVTAAPPIPQRTPAAGSNNAPANSHIAQSSNGEVLANATRTNSAIPTSQNSEDVRGPDGRIDLSMKGDT